MWSWLLFGKIYGLWCLTPLSTIFQSYRAGEKIFLKKHGHTRLLNKNVLTLTVCIQTCYYAISFWLLTIKSKDCLYFFYFGLRLGLWCWTRLNNKSLHRNRRRSFSLNPGITPSRFSFTKRCFSIRRQCKQTNGLNQLNEFVRPETENMWVIPCKWQADHSIQPMWL